MPTQTLTNIQKLKISTMHTHAEQHSHSFHV